VSKLDDAYIRALEATGLARDQILADLKRQAAKHGWDIPPDHEVLRLISNALSTANIDGLARAAVPAIKQLFAEGSGPIGETDLTAHA
jgi:hypothetical protein